jgi:hypothetical protein
VGVSDDAFWSELNWHKVLITLSKCIVSTPLRKVESRRTLEQFESILTFDFLRHFNVTRVLEATKEFAVRDAHCQQQTRGLIRRIFSTARLTMKITVSLREVFFVQNSSESDLLHSARQSVSA